MRLVSPFSHNSHRTIAPLSWKHLASEHTGQLCFSRRSQSLDVPQSRSLSESRRFYLIIGEPSWKFASDSSKKTTSAMAEFVLGIAVRSSPSRLDDWFTHAPHAGKANRLSVGLRPCKCRTYTTLLQLKLTIKVSEPRSK